MFSIYSRNLAVFSAAVICLTASYAETTQAQSAYFREATLDRELQEGIEDYATEGIQAGAFVYYPRLSNSLSYDSNVFAVDDNVDSDFIYMVSPSLRVQSDWERNAIYASGNLVREEYFDNNNESAFSGSVGLGGTYELGEFNALKAGLNYTSRAEDRTGALSPVSSVERIRLNSAGKALSFTRTVNFFRFTAGFDYDVFDYDDGFTDTGLEIDQDFLDFERYLYSTRLDYAISPSLALFTAATYNVTDFDLEASSTNPDRDSNGYSTVVGVDFAVTDLIRAEASVGLFNQTFESDLLDDTTGLLVKAGADWFVTPVTTLYFDISRNRDEESSAQGSDSILDSYSVRADQRLSENLLLTGSLGYAAQAFQTISRDDTLLNAGLGLKYYLTERLNTGIRYTYFDRVSEGNDNVNDFTKNVVAGSVTLQF